MGTELLAGLLQFIVRLLDFYEILIFASALLSWVNPDPYNPIVRFVRQVTDPALRPFRNLMWPLTRRWGVDLSPLLLLLALHMVSILLSHAAFRLQFGSL